MDTGASPLTGPCNQHLFTKKTTDGSSTEFGLKISTWTKSDKIVMPSKPKHDGITIVSALHGNECIQVESKYFETEKYLHLYINGLEKGGCAI